MSSSLLTSYHTDVPNTPENRENNFEEFYKSLHFSRFEAPFTQENEAVTVENTLFFEQAGEFLFAHGMRSIESDHRHVHVSTDEGQTFFVAHFPVAGRHTDFTLVDASEGVLFVAMTSQEAVTFADFYFHVSS